ncbi:MAG: lysophospholipase [Gemmatimonadaceae bacterium]|nr:lysophospholipase [Gemmatimonadaceae bacterium]
MLDAPSLPVSPARLAVVLGGLALLVASPLRAQDTTRVVDDTIRLETPTGTLVGSLMRPRAASGAVPVVFIHPGSGPTTRDGNTVGMAGRNESLRQLAESLATHGIASVRIDKRGIGASRAALTMRPDSVTIDLFIDDARAWLRHLVADRRFAAVHALGHSEGALIVARAARDVAVAGVILVAGPGEPLGRTLRAQLADPTRLPPALLPAADSAILALETGAPLPTLPPVLRPLFAPVNERFLRSIVARDPRADVAALRVPVLVVQGTTDLQVGVADARALAAANPPRTTLVLVEGVNHVLKRVAGPLPQQLGSYLRPDPGTDGAVVTPIVEAVRRRR